MRKFVVLSSMILWLKIPAYNQDYDSIYPISLTLISQVNQGNSYITFPADIGNIEPLWFEGNVIPNFYLRESQNSRLLGVLTPQIVLRMYQEESFPVRTPSYVPQVTVYYRLSDIEKNRSLNIFGRAAHHSNGQDGSFFLEDGSLNLKSGNFSTNFLELGIIATNRHGHLNAYQFYKTSFEIHPQGFMQDELLGIYSQYRWHNTFSIFKLSTENNKFVSAKPAISLKGETTWMFGNFNQLEFISTRRLNLGLTFYYHPGFMEDIGLFVQYYHGSDYYNIYFDHRLDILRFGIMTDKLRF